MSPAPAVAALLAAALVLPTAAGAQALMGRVVDGATREPVPNAVIVLLDSARQRLNGALSDSTGSFLLFAPGAGRYQLLAERVGSVTATSELLTLAATDTARVQLSLGAAQRLSTVRVTDRERCSVRPEEGQAAARLWDEARKALSSVALAEERGRTPVRLVRFARQFRSDGRALARESWSLAPSPVRQFRSESVEVLNLEGFVQGTRGAGGRDTLVYSAPDAEVLLSEAFLASHCLRAVAPTGRRAGQLGLAFEPVRRRGPKRTDVRGTLWVDTASYELREFEFTYTDLPDNAPPGHAGGRVGFARLPDGTWYVDAWQITMPSVEELVTTREGSSTLLSPSAGPVRVVEQSPTRAEQGGRTLVPGPPRVPDGHTVLMGMVTDSSDGVRPIVGARVTVGPTHEAFTDDGGEFYAEVPLRGIYRVRVETPRAVSLGVSWTTWMELGGATLKLDVAIPSTTTLRRLHCPTTAPADTTAPLLAGVVRTWTRARRAEPSELRVAGNASVQVEWRLPEWPQGWVERRTVRTIANGHYRVCEVPAGADFTLRASQGELRSESWSGRVGAGAVLTRDLLLEAAPKEQR
jgi:hypothetical protein